MFLFSLSFFFAAAAAAAVVTRAEKNEAHGVERGAIYVVSMRVLVQGG